MMTLSPDTWESWSDDTWKGVGSAEAAKLGRLITIIIELVVDSVPHAPTSLPRRLLKEIFLIVLLEFAVLVGPH